jgi:hypothetical protein
MIEGHTAARSAWHIGGVWADVEDIDMSTYMDRGGYGEN